jgi:hypothetical protein
VKVYAGMALLADKGSSRTFPEAIDGLTSVRVNASIAFLADKVPLELPGR